MGGLGFPEIFLIALVLGLLVLPLWAAFDANSRPARHWGRIGQNQTVWVIVLLGGFFLAPLGLLAAIVYFTTVRPKLGRAGPLEGSAG